MHYDNNNKRIHWLTISLNASPDILIAVIIVVVMKGGLATFLVVFLALQLVYPLLWLKNALVKWLLLISSRQRASNNAWKWTYLRANGYPEPDHREQTPEHYLSSVIENVSLPDDMRLKAAFDLGTINAMSTNGELHHLPQGASYENALVQAKNVFSKKPG
jgi:hypothetical protein